MPLVGMSDWLLTNGGGKVIRLTHEHWYKTSRDYELLIDMMQKSSVICFVDYVWGDGEITRDVAATVYRPSVMSDDIFDISCRGTSYAYSWSTDMFIRVCQKYNVEFIVPQVGEAPQ